VGIDQPWGKSVGQAYVPPHSKDWMVISAPVKKTEGVHAVWLRFYGKDDALFEVDWLRFK
jgi:hypothetical protein